jgi:IS605 OrfB family transposase
MLRTVSIPTDLEPERFLPLLKQSAEIFNAHVAWALENHTYNKSRAHHALYTQLRYLYPEIPSAFIQSIRDMALEAVKATKFERRPRKKPASSLRYDKRTMTLRGYQLTLSCIGPRVKTILTVPDYFREIFETWEFKGATLSYKRHKRQMWVQLVFECPTPDQHVKGETQGIDRGLYHLAVTSDGHSFSNAKVRSVQRKYLYNRRTLQAKGTRSAKRRLKAMSGREKRFSREVNHRVTKQLANQPDVTRFVLEDLSGIRNQQRGKKMNKWLGSWPFHQFETFLAYKAQALGKAVVFVDARYTSQKCNQCGHIYKGNRQHSRFLCVRCGFRAHADRNAALNIRDTYLLSTAERSVEQVVVNQPNATDFGSVASHRACPGGH